MWSTLCPWVSAIACGIKGSKPGWHHCLLFKGEALHSFSASLHSRMQGGGFDAQWTNIPTRLNIKLLLVSSNPLINIYILHNAPYTFPMVLKRRICSMITSFFSLQPFLLFLKTFIFDSTVILWGEIWSQSFLGVKRLIKQTLG